MRTAVSRKREAGDKAEYNLFFDECVDEIVKYNIKCIELRMLATTKEKIEYTIELPYVRVEPLDPRYVPYGLNMGRHGDDVHRFPRGRILTHSDRIRPPPPKGNMHLDDSFRYSLPHRQDIPVHPFLRQVHQIDKMRKSFGNGKHIKKCARTKVVGILKRAGYKVSPPEFNRNELPLEDFVISWEKPSRLRLFQGLVRFLIITIRYRDDYYAPNGKWHNKAKESFEEFKIVKDC